MTSVELSATTTTSNSPEKEQQKSVVILLCFDLIPLFIKYDFDQSLYILTTKNNHDFYLVTK